jgi:hypothetical protein
MQEPTEEPDSPISAENEREDPNLNGAFTEHRKAAKRTLPWDLASGELYLAKDIPATKKPRLEEPSPASTDEAAANISLRDTTVSLPVAAVANHVDADPLKGTRATGRWTPEEDATLNSAVTKTCMRKFGNEYIQDWVAVAAQVQGRDEKQCNDRWHNNLDPSIDQATVRTGTWAEDEDIKLKDAVQTHGDKDWVAVTALVPSRTQKQCYNRWKDALDPGIDRVTGSKGSWTAADDSNLKDAVYVHGSKDWARTTALVPGRVESQCRSRWQVLRRSLKQV